VSIPSGIRRGGVVFAVILIASLAADQLSKAWARTLPGVPQPVVNGYWDWELAYNPGIAFSGFASAAGHTWMRVILAVIAVIALVGISLLALRTAPEQRWRRVAYALIAGGALGNLVDRVRDGAVTDFVRWRIHDHRWPIFNVADAVLVVGVAVLLLDELRARRAPTATQ
jgi:signal peptidase II